MSLTQNVNTYMHERQRKIIQALKEGGLDPYKLAEKIDEPAYVVIAELKQLRRRQLVRGTILINSMRWTLTDRGTRIAYHADQEELFV